MYRLIIILTILLSLLSFIFIFLRNRKAQAHLNLVKICHATSSPTNPYVSIVVNHDAIGGHFFNNGTPKAGHEDDILYQNSNTPCPSGIQPTPTRTLTPEPPSPTPTEIVEPTITSIPEPTSMIEPTEAPCEDDCQPTPSSEPTRTEPTPTQGTQISVPSGDSTDHNKAGDYDDPLCTGQSPDKPILTFKRLSPTSVKFFWQYQNDIDHYAFSYGYKSAEEMGIPEITGQAIESTVNGLHSNSYIFGQLIAWDNEHCISKSDIVDP